jgi:hypothetical protein
MRLAIRLAAGSLVVGALSMLPACSRSEDDRVTSGASGATSQAQAAQSSLAAAQAAHDQHVHNAMTDEAGAAPMGMPADSAAAAPMGMPAGSATGAAMAPAAPSGMARLLGRPPAMNAPPAIGALPTAMGAPHIYHLGADGFFADQSPAIGFTPEQQTKLAAIKEKATSAYATVQRKIDQAEQDLWLLTSVEKPDGAKIDAKVADLGRLTGQQRIDYIRSIGEAVGVLTDAQRKAVVAQAPVSMPPGATPAPMAPGMPMASAAPPMGGMAKGKDMGMGMKPPSGSMAAPPDAGMPGMAAPTAAPAMGHM